VSSLKKGKVRRKESGKEKEPKKEKRNFLSFLFSKLSFTIE